jgi:catabolite regulation protein CreA
MFNITTAAYFLAMVVFIIYLTSKSEQVGLVATIVSWAGFACNTVAIDDRNAVAACSERSWGDGICGCLYNKTRS